MFSVSEIFQKVDRRNVANMNSARHFPGREFCCTARLGVFPALSSSCWPARSSSSCGRQPAVVRPAARV